VVDSARSLVSGNGADGQGGVNGRQVRLINFFHANLQNYETAMGKKLKRYSFEGRNIVGK